MIREFPGEQLMKNACAQPDVLSLAELAKIGTGSVSWPRVFTLPDQRRDHLQTEKEECGCELHLPKMGRSRLP